MHIFSSNEWNQLKSIIVGSASYANWPVHCPDFRKLEQTTLWKETPVPIGPVPEQVIIEANSDLDELANFLTTLGVNVLRPTEINFVERDGFYNYCPRDRLLVVDDVVIDPQMPIGCRQMEIEAYDFLETTYVKAKGKFDAANICRLNDDLLYLISETGDLEGAHWLADYFEGRKTVHILDNIYSGVHIDSTIIPVHEGLVVLNSKRVNDDNMPEPLKNWDKIWIHECEHQPFYNYPYASNWIGINFLVYDETSVICDPKQTILRKELDKYKVDSVGIDIRHSRTLGGGHHCVTLDILR